MTLESSVSKISYMGNGSTGPFPIVFQFTKKDQVKAVKLVNNIQSNLTQNVDFTVLETSDNKGSLNTTVPLLSGEKITIYREVEETQGLDLINGGKPDFEGIERGLDKLTMIAQQQAEEIERSVKVDISSDISPENLMEDLNSKVNEANVSAQNSKISEINAKNSETNAKISEVNAKGSENNAATTLNSATGLIENKKEESITAIQAEKDSSIAAIAAMPNYNLNYQHLADSTFNKLVTGDPEIVGKEKDWKCVDKRVFNVISSEVVTTNIGTFVKVKCDLINDAVTFNAEYRYKDDDYTAFVTLRDGSTLPVIAITADGTNSFLGINPKSGTDLDILLGSARVEVFRSVGTERTGTISITEYLVGGAKNEDRISGFDHFYDFTRLALYYRTGSLFNFDGTNLNFYLTNVYAGEAAVSGTVEFYYWSTPSGERFSGNSLACHYDPATRRVNISGNIANNLGSIDAFELYINFSGKFYYVDATKSTTEVGILTTNNFTYNFKVQESGDKRGILDSDNAQGTIIDYDDLTLPPYTTPYNINDNAYLNAGYYLGKEWVSQSLHDLSLIDSSYVKVKLSRPFLVEGDIESMFVKKKDGSYVDFVTKFSIHPQQNELRLQIADALDELGFSSFVEWQSESDIKYTYETNCRRLQQDRNNYKAIYKSDTVFFLGNPRQKAGKHIINEIIDSIPVLNVYNEQINISKVIKGTVYINNNIFYDKIYYHEQEHRFKESNVLCCSYELVIKDNLLHLLITGKELIFDESYNDNNYINFSQKNSGTGAPDKTVFLDDAGNPCYLATYTYNLGISVN